MNHRGLRWNVHCLANVGLRKRLNLYKRGFKIYDLLVLVMLLREIVLGKLGAINFSIRIKFVSSEGCFNYRPSDAVLK